VVEGRRMPYHKGLKIDPSDSFNGEKFANIDDLRRILLKDKDQLARALAEKLVAYSTGAAPTALDRAEVEEIVKRAREKGYGVRTLVQEVVQSKLFLHK
jgi:hypothetical protein